MFVYVCVGAIHVDYRCPMTHRRLSSVDICDSIYAIITVFFRSLNARNICIGQSKRFHSDIVADIDDLRVWQNEVDKSRFWNLLLEIVAIIPLWIFALIKLRRLDTDIWAVRN